MSILDTLLGSIFGSDNEKDQQEQVVERPCSTCPGNCRIAPNACSVCQPYKEELIDAIYWVDHEDELISRYEVTGTAGAQTGAVTCPHCGGASEDHFVCEYCGSKLQEGSSKIRVASASEIPDPVMQTQDLIFQRYEAVKGFPGADEAYGLTDALSGVETEGLLSSIFNALLGSGDSNDSRTIGNKMSRSEIEEMAAFYGVSLSDYLMGLDNGKYLTLSNKKAAAKAESEYAKNQQNSQSGSGLSSLAGMAGMAGLAGLGSMLFGGSNYNYSAARKPAAPKPTVVVTKPSTAQTSHNTTYGNNQVAGHKRPSPNMPPRPSGSTQNRPSGTPHGMFGQGRPSGMPPRPSGSTQGRPSGAPQGMFGQTRPSGTTHGTSSRPSFGGQTKPAPKQSGIHHDTQPRKAEKMSSQINKTKAQDKIAQKAKKQPPRKG